ncbi:MAG: flagellar export chaperone FliS [Desulfitobacteriaceae bacterium]|nr:flagellar export chaperone FliS [Desulfitobacteriaceae bacterium]MDI6879460.1 flagellar export chaperone FliS [Desulfitobacteriaceae bacterium]MDI6912947.1 flagellar export chaperone FliS [Desulfitobacteriaceae bacterium]
MSMPMPASNPYGMYHQTSIITASPEKLLLLLFDGAIKRVRQAAVALGDQDWEKAHVLLLRIQDIFSELENTLNPEAGELASNLGALYAFYRQEVVKANLEKNSQYLEPVLEFLRDYRQMWEEVARLARQPNEGK